MKNHTRIKKNAHDLSRFIQFFTKFGDAMVTPYHIHITNESQPGWFEVTVDGCRVFNALVNKKMHILGKKTKQTISDMTFGLPPEPDKDSQNKVTTELRHLGQIEVIRRDMWQDGFWTRSMSRKVPINVPGSHHGTASTLAKVTKKDCLKASEGKYGMAVTHSGQQSYRIEYSQNRGYQNEVPYYRPGNVLGSLVLKYRPRHSLQLLGIKLPPPADLPSTLHRAVKKKNETTKENGTETMADQNGNVPLPLREEKQSEEQPVPKILGQDPVQSQSSDEPLQSEDSSPPKASTSSAEPSTSDGQTDSKASDRIEEPPKSPSPEDEADISILSKPPLKGIKRKLSDCEVFVSPLLDRTSVNSSKYKGPMQSTPLPGKELSPVLSAGRIKMNLFSPSLQRVEEGKVLDLSSPKKEGPSQVTARSQRPPTFEYYKRALEILKSEPGQGSHVKLHTEVDGHKYFSVEHIDEDMVMMIPEGNDDSVIFMGDEECHMVEVTPPEISLVELNSTNIGSSISENTPLNTSMEY